MSFIEFLQMVAVVIIVLIIIDCIGGIIDESYYKKGWMIA
jgi:phage-related holin